MIYVVYGEQGRPIHRLSRQLVEAIKGSGRRALAVSASGLPGVISRAGEAPSHIIGAWWLGVSAVLHRIPTHTKLITCVYDHETHIGNAAQFAMVAEQSVAVFAANPALCEEVAGALISGGIETPVLLMTDGVDHNHFTPGPGPMGGPLRVGWCGDPYLERIKRTSMVRSACSALDDIELDFLDSRNGRPHEDMPDWYRGLDVILCTSAYEGTPNPILEAAACGVPYVSTPVGIVPELHKQTGHGGGWLIEGPNERESLIDGFRAALAIGRPGLRSKGLLLREAIVDGWSWGERQAPCVVALGGTPAPPTKPSPVLPVETVVVVPEREGPPRVLLVYDCDGWAFHNITKQIERHLGDEFVFESVAYPDIPRKGQRWARQFDAVVNLAYFGHPELKNSIGAEPEGEIITCVYDHNLWPGIHRGTLARAIDESGLVLAANKKLKGQVSKAFRADVGLCSDGVDSDLFVPLKPRRRMSKKRPLRVGWAGSTSAHKALKGLEIIRMAIGGLNYIDLVTLDSAPNGKKIPHHKMPKWYQALDVYVCMSSHEGTPNPVLEAAACGVGVISTRVGIVPELFADARNKPGYMIDRNAKALRAALNRFNDDRKLISQTGRAARAAILAGAWTWKQRAEQFRTAIREVLECC